MFVGGRVFIVAALVAAFAWGTHAFAASSTISPSSAGQASASISGYSASGIGYALNAADPSRIDAVTFTIAPAGATQVKVRLVSGGSTWYPCTVSGGSATCATTSPQATLASASALDLIATG